MSSTTVEILGGGKSSIKQCVQLLFLQFKLWLFFLVTQGQPVWKQASYFCSELSGPFKMSPLNYSMFSAPFSQHHTTSRRHLNAASAGPAERVEEVRKPAELGPIGPTQTPRLSSLGRKRLCGSLSGLKKKNKSHCFYSIAKFRR